MSNQRTSKDRKSENGEVTGGRNEDDDQLSQKRATKWLLFSQSKAVVGFDRIPKSMMPSMSSKPRGLTLCFEKILGWSIPVDILQAVDSGECRLSVQLGLSMFHLESKTFFGSTWLGQLLVLNESDKGVMADVIDISYSEIIYMVTRLTDPSCVAVVEIVVSRISNDNEMVISQHGCGWSILPLFDHPTIDISDGYQSNPSVTNTIYEGSPRLLVTVGYSQLQDRLKELVGCTMQYKLFDHSKLLKARCLVSENELIGRFDVIPGLLSKVVTLPQEVVSKSIPCIGDSEILIDKKGMCVVPCAPKLSRTLRTSVIDLQVLIPDREKYEGKARVQVTRQIESIDPSKATIVCRKLRIGFHNGHAVVSPGGEFHTILLETIEDDPDILVTSAKDAVYSLPGYCPHDLTALVVFLEYDIGVPKENVSQLNKKLAIDSTQQKDAFTVTTICLGCGVYLPSDGTIFRLRNLDQQGDDGDIGIEIPLRVDSICQLMTRNPVFKYAVRKGKKSTGKKIAEKKTNRESTARANAASIEEESEGEGEGEGEGEDDEEELQNLSTSSDSILLSFDIKIFDFDDLEVRHLDDVDSVMRAVESAKGDSEEEDVGKKSSSKYRKPPRPSIQSTRKKRDDDSISVVSTVSLVGGDSLASSLRLDPKYYESDSEQVDLAYGGYSTDRRDERPRQSAPMSSLFNRAMQTRLVSGAAGHTALLEDRRGQRESVQTPVNYVADRTLTAVSASVSHVRNLSRGAKSKLNRHGFGDAIEDSSRVVSSENVRGHRISGVDRPQALANNSNAVVDVELESRNKLQLNEISIQFAGLRCGASSTGKKSSFGFSPKAVYFSFQFYTCRPSRTEVMRVQPSDQDGILNVLTRDEARHEPSLALRFSIDCSTVSLTESLDFAHYLAYKTLHVDVWDADSLMLLGTVCIPLRKFMRQGEDVAKASLECDIVDSEGAARTEPGGITTSIVLEGGPVAGHVVGSVQVLLANYGQEGVKRRRAGPNALPEKTKDVFNSNEGLNWRTIGKPANGAAAKRNRPNLSVRARPLSESAPELSQALDDLKYSSASGKQSQIDSMRSLSAIRGSEGIHTLTYDDVVRLFKRFQGTVKGTVQYVGPLLVLLDVPSNVVAVRKLLKAFKLSKARGENMEKRILQYSNGQGNISVLDLREFLSDFFDEFIPSSYKTEEIVLLSNTFFPLEHGHEQINTSETIKPRAIVQFCLDEMDKQDWIISSKHLRHSVQRAILAGLDVEQMLAEKDYDGDQLIATNDFDAILRHIARYGNMKSVEVEIVVRKFTKEQSRKISCREFMLFLGKTYVGNVDARLRKVLLRSQQKVSKDVLLVLCGSSKSLPSEDKETGGAMIEDPVSMKSLSKLCHQRSSLGEIERRLEPLEVYEQLSHDNIRKLLLKVANTNAKDPDTLSVVDFLDYLKIDYNGIIERKEAVSSTATPEQLLLILVERAKQDGISIEQTFRHFDMDGNGSINEIELMTGLEQLGIFNNVPNWKAQIPSIMLKFDSSGDGSIQLKEFFKFLGNQHEYIPNIIQKLTKIFVVAMENSKVSLKSIFSALDKDNSGELSYDELYEGIQTIGKFSDITKDDVIAMTKEFTTRKDSMISVNDFVSFFGNRVKQAAKERKERNVIRIQSMFRAVVETAVAGGVTLEQIFSFFDADKGSTVSRDEFLKGLKAMPNLNKKLNEEDLKILMSMLDADNSGTIELNEFKNFIFRNSSGTEDSVGDTSSPRVVPVFQRLNQILLGAQKRGKSPHDVFAGLDKNGDGSLTVVELEEGLKRLPFFRELTSADFKELFNVIDSDNSGEVSVDEFIEIVINGGIIPKQKESGSRHDNKSKKMSPLEEFVRSVAKVAESDRSGIEGVIAYLDDDGDGLISLNSLLRFMHREKLLSRKSTDQGSSLMEDTVEEILKPIIRKDGNITVTGLLHVFRNCELPSEVLEHTKINKNDFSDDDEDVDDRRRADTAEYKFSNDPETHALEKKLRGIGRLLAKKGVNVDSFFKAFDARESGMIRRSELLQVLSKMGLYILEQGKVLREQSGDMSEESNVRLQQQRQLQRLRKGGASLANNATRLSGKLISGDQSNSDFKEHLETMALVNWYRQGQKKMMLQRVLSHSLSSSVHLYPRFGKTLFFEYPVTNPFGHEERFLIEVSDPELRVVTSFDEWMNLRHMCAGRPCVGELGMEPVEAEMFDKDGLGNCQVALLSHETLHIPFAFISHSPLVPQSKFKNVKNLRKKKSAESKSETRFAGRRYDTDSKSDDENELKKASHSEEGGGGEEEEEAHRAIEVRFISGSHGHVVSVLRVNICPRSFVIDRSLRFYEPENSIMKRRIQLTGYNSLNLFPGETVASMKYVMCVESESSDKGVDSEGAGSSKVLVEWGPSKSGLSNALDIIVRYRCGSFPHVGSFYILLYDDPYQSSLHEIWYVTVQTRQRLDLHCALGAVVPIDLVVRGDRFARRSRAYSSLSMSDNAVDNITFQPNSSFQLVAGAYNRVVLNFNPRILGQRRIQINLVDVDTRELVSSWLLMALVASPVVMRSYDVDLLPGTPQQKKIVFQNPWDIPRRFHLVSSDDTIMRPRTEVFEVAGHGNAYMKLWFCGALPNQQSQDVYLFLNDERGQSEECFLFQIRGNKL